MLLRKRARVLLFFFFLHLCRVTVGVFFFFSFSYSRCTVKKRFEHIFTRFYALGIFLHNFHSTKEVAAFFFFSLISVLIWWEGRASVQLDCLL